MILMHCESHVGRADGERAVDAILFENIDPIPTTAEGMMPCQDELHSLENSPLSWFMRRFI